MLLTNLTNPGQPPVEGDLVKIKQGNSVIEKVYHEPVEFIADIIPPKWTKTEFLDEVGDDALDQFIALLDAGDVDAKRFQYRLESTDLVDTGHEKVKAGLDWLAANNSVPGFTNSKRDKLKGV